MAAKWMSYGWRPSTRSNYAYTLRQWTAFCDARGWDPLNGTVTQGVEFIANLAETTDRGYSSINAARAALGYVIPSTESSTFGKHRNVTLLLKGVGN